VIRAKTVVDSKFPDTSFREILGSQGPKKTPLVAPRFSEVVHSSKLKHFRVSTFFGFFLPCSLRIKKSKYREHLEQRMVFFTIASHVRSGKTQRYNIFPNKKNSRHRESLSSTCRKNFSSIGCIMREKPGRFCRFFLENQVVRQR
jgi:hypothetical protein